METNLRISKSYYPTEPINNVNDWMKMFNVSSALRSQTVFNERAAEMNAQYSKSRLLEMIKKMKCNE